MFSKFKEFSSRMGEGCVGMWIGEWGPAHHAAFPRYPLSRTVNILQELRESRHSPFTGSIWLSQSITIWLRSWVMLFWWLYLVKGFDLLSDGFGMIKMCIRSEKKNSRRALLNFTLISRVFFSSHPQGHCTPTKAAINILLLPGQFS